MGDRDIIDEIDDDSADNTAISRRLNRALAIQQKVTARLNAILTVAVSPGPPDGPTTCDAIVTEANNSITAAQSIKRKFGIIG